MQYVSKIYYIYWLNVKYLIGTRYSFKLIVLNNLIFKKNYNGIFQLEILNTRSNI